MADSRFDLFLFDEALFDEPEIFSVLLTGVSSAESVSNITANRGAVSLYPTALDSGYASGTLQLNRNLTITGTSSGETFGTLTVNRGSVSVYPTGIATGYLSGT